MSRSDRLFDDQKTASYMGKVIVASDIPIGYTTYTNSYVR